MPVQVQVSNATRENLVIVAKTRCHPHWMIHAGYELPIVLPIIADCDVKFKVYHCGHKVIKFSVNDKGQVKHIKNHSSRIKLLSNKIFPYVNTDHPTLYFLPRCEC